MRKTKHWIAAAGMLLLAAVLPMLVAGAGPVRQTDVYYYGEDGMVAKTPVVTGTFIQPGLCESWTAIQWDRHLDMLLSAGIDTVILQWTAETPDGEVSYADFPVPKDWKKSVAGLNQHSDAVEKLLNSAEKKQVKVFLGLNLAEEWWGNSFLDDDWCKKQADTGNSIAKELYDLYKEKYPNAFHGWYWAWEMYGNTLGFEKHWSGLMNANLDFLTTLDSGMPLLFSPFMSSYLRLTPSQEEAMWSGFIASTRLRQGDIFCPQDSVGAAGFTMAYADRHLAAMKRAADKKPGLLFWVNNENFTKDLKPATLDRFVSQLYVSGKYTDTHMCFAYSHYYSPNLVNPSFDRDYKAFVASGIVERTPPAQPELSAEVSGDGSLVTLTVTSAEAADFHIFTLFKGNRVIDTREVTDAVSGPYRYGKAFQWKKGESAVFYATVSDCWGNVSGKAAVTVNGGH
jgi:hypothetical protein